jgi:limonene-1,2-epoxide hydrolase
MVEYANQYRKNMALKPPRFPVIIVPHRTRRKPMADNAEIVREFIGCWSKLDPEELAGYFAEDGCYYNMPFQPVKGKEAVLGFITEFTKTWTETDWEILNLVESGDVVVCERVDRTRSTSGNVDLPCVGVFEMRDGKISEWRDYFDLATYTNAMSG